MKLGIMTTAVDVAPLAQKAEELGFDSFWVPEHPIIPVKITPKTTNFRMHLEADGTPQPLYTETHWVDSFISLARASAVTRTIRLGTGICLVPEHNPILLAKQAATLDRYSGGRFIFGIGAGWLQEETEIMGGDFEHRWGQTREAVMVMKGLWAMDEVEFHGKYYNFPLVRSFPKPLQPSGPRIYVGAFTMGNVFRRIASYGHGWITWMLSPEQVQQGRDMLYKTAAEFGRDPKSIEVVAAPVPPDLEGMKAFEDAGADSGIIFLMPGEEKPMMDELERIADLALK
jgi:probable F420-dependent oxidoreductase